MLDSHLIAKTNPKSDSDNIIIYGNYRITVLFERLFRIEYSETRNFCDDATQAVWFRNMNKVQFSAEEKDDRLFIRTSLRTLIIGKTVEECRVIIDGREFPLDNSESFYGTYRTLDCCDGENLIDDDGNKSPITLGFGVASKNGVAVYEDSKSLILKSDGTLAERNEETDLYVFAYGHAYRDAVKALYSICGNTPVIPRFALGNWWSRYHAYTDVEYLQTMDRLKKRRIPITVATVDMDWHWSTTLDERKGITESGKNDEFHGYPARGWTGYSWNTDLFPDYKDFLNKLHERGLHVTLNLHPARGVRYYEDMYTEMAEAVGINPETEQVVDFDFTSEKFINAYFRILHKPYERDGVDFWWIDWQQGTKSALAGLDPLWALNHYHSLDIAKEKQQLILSRYGGIGSHRYPLGFSGDTFVTWETLSFLPYFTANAANAGYSWWSHDIGGHMAGIKDDELYVRFVQFGVFSPVNRLHCTDSVLSTKEPMVYMDGKGLIAEEFLRLRHRLIPYLYSAAVKTNREGIALCEPLYYEYPDCKEAYLYKNEYLFGGQLLCAPITQKGDENSMAKADIWLPEGRWTDIFTGDEYTGGKEISIVRWTDTIPVFAREGGIYVLDGRDFTNDTSEPDILDVFAYSGNGSYNLYEENVVTEIRNILSGDTQAVKFMSKQAISRQISLHLPNIRAGQVNVYVNGKKTQFELDSDGELQVKFTLNSNACAEVIVKAEAESKRQIRNRMLHYSMIRITGDHRKRSKLLKDLFDMNDDECIAAIQSADFLTDNDKERLLEGVRAQEKVKSGK